jgi:hypothetical protein
MVRLVDLPPATQTGMRNLDCPTFEQNPFVSGPLLRARRIAVVTSADWSGAASGHSPRVTSIIAFFPATPPPTRS